MRRTDSADDRADSRNGERGCHRFPGADAFNCGIDPDPIRHLLDRLDRRFTALGDDVGGTE